MFYLHEISCAGVQRLLDYNWLSVKMVMPCNRVVLNRNATKKGLDNGEADLGINCKHAIVTGKRIEIGISIIRDHFKK